VYATLYCNEIHRYYSVGPLPAFSSIPLVRLVTGLFLAVAGQILNVAVYKAIGKAGVYYGCKLGRPHAVIA
jgi:hypothetical protein